MASLRGKTIAITEARRAAELATLIAKLGGIPYSAPALREIPRHDRGPALAALDRICAGEVAVIVFLTGVGTRAFLELAATTARREALLSALASMRVAARGPKPIAVLREAGIRIDVVPSVPTSDGLLSALAPHDMAGRVVAVQLYGEENGGFVQGLQARGARVLEIPLYDWAPPQDEQVLARLIRDVIDHRIDVVAFTSSPQIRHVMAAAERLALREELVAALRDGVTVAVVGPVCEAACREHGIIPRVQPDKGTLGALVHSIARCLNGEE